MTHKATPKPPSQPKRVQITDPSGWTHIIKGNKSQRSQLHIQPKHTLKPQDSAPDMTLEKATRELARYTQEWRRSACCAQLRTILEKGVLSAENVRISDCLCLGLGTLTGEDAFRASWWELAALVFVLEVLGGKHPLKNVYFQDPLFNDLDEKFLHTLGYTVIHGSASREKILPETFLYAPHLEYTHISSNFQSAFPALYIGSALECWLDAGAEDETASLASKRIFKTFLAARQTRAMPQFEADQWWRYIGICWLSAG